MGVFLGFFLAHLVSCSAAGVASAAGERCVRQVKAAYAPSLSPLPQGGGVCGYGAMAAEINGGFLAAGGPRLHRGRRLGVGFGGQSSARGVAIRDHAARRFGGDEEYSAAGSR